jgi:hypothetical protein
MSMLSEPLMFFLVRTSRRRMHSALFENRLTHTVAYQRDAPCLVNTIWHTLQRHTLRRRLCRGAGEYTVKRLARC